MTDTKVTISRETLQSALDAVDPHFRWHTAIVNLRAALAAQPATVQPVEPSMDTVLRNAARRSAKIVDRGRMVKPVEPVAWLHIQGNHTEPSLWRLDADEITRGWTEVPLYAAPPAPAAVPPGYVLAPIEPSPAQRIAGAVALMKASDSDLDCTTDEIAAAYHAMIRAAGDKS